MLVPRFHRLNFSPEISQIIQMVAQNPGSFFLDSSDSTHPRSRYSYAGINPQKIISGDDSPWLKLEEAYATKNRILVGYLSYESGINRELVPQALPTVVPIPLYQFGAFDSILMLDHREKKSFLISWSLSPDQLKKEENVWRDALEKTFIHPEKNQASFDIQIPWSFAAYENKIGKIKKYLEAGDIYQINLTGRFEGKTDWSTQDIYNRLRQISPAPYSALINGGSFQILSASPESFIEIKDEKIFTKPIKGTRKRGKTLEEDKQLRTELLSSVKDRAELLMIVDLERNDLGKICEYGSVKADPIFEVESFAQVHHLVATISGRLKKNITPIDALKSIFPGGSVTGAPKIRAMEIIAELEENPRSVYTGALGFIWPDGTSAFNIPIRTLTKSDKKVYFHAGGGIVADSDPREEYEEMLLKTEGILKALQINGPTKK